MMLKFKLNSLWKMGAILTLATGVLSACEAHDYWLLSDTLTVDSSQDIYKASNGDEISQDLFVRYQLDYELENTSSSQSTEVVVSATSYVNGFARATGHKVWHLDPSQKVQGILMTNQLELGNKLTVSLECCTTSVCTNKEVICPSNDEYTSLPGISEVAEFCYDSCESIDDCLKDCPSESSCKSICPDDDEACRTAGCSEKLLTLSCDYLCNHDEDCMSTCEPTKECQSICTSLRASCFKNCLATWNRCEEDYYQPDTDIIPCSLCGGEGSCHINLSTTVSDEWYITSTSGETYTCNLECRYYPPECVTGCEELYEGKTDRIACLDRCLQQQLFWCNDFEIPYDYVDSQGTQPCCFETTCQGALEGVVKSYDVECFNDTSCSSGKVCSSEGICVSSTSDSSCQATPLVSNHGFSLYWLLLLIGGYRIRRKGAENG